MIFADPVVLDRYTRHRPAGRATNLRFPLPACPPPATHFPPNSHQCREPDLWPWLYRDCSLGSDGWRLCGSSYCATPVTALYRMVTEPSTSRCRCPTKTQGWELAGGQRVAAFFGTSLYLFLSAKSRKVDSQHQSQLISQTVHHCSKAARARWHRRTSVEAAEKTGEDSFGSDSPLPDQERLGQSRWSECGKRKSFLEQVESVFEKREEGR